MAASALHIFESDSNLISSLAQLIKTKQDDVVKKLGKHFHIGVSGGSVAKYLSEGLPKLCTELDINMWRIYFCDERHVPLDDDESTYKYYKENLFKTMNVPEHNVYKINSNVSVEKAALDYQTELDRVPSKNGFPQFDVLVLGMGPDGHTCSLFPWHPLLEEKSVTMASISDSPKPPLGRITMTYSVLNNAKCVIFISTGEGKAQILKRVLEGNDLIKLPAARVAPTNGELHWFLDEGAAKLLDRRE